MQPLLLIVEDVHWADRSTRDLLSFLFARSFRSPVTIVASYRSDDLHRRHPLRAVAAQWARVPGVHRLQLDPLPDPDVRRLVAALTSSPLLSSLTESEVQAIVTRAEGNAFFAEELVGAATGGPGRVGMPEDLADLLLVRLDRLDDSAREVVRAAAAAGRRVSHAAAGLRRRPSTTTTSTARCATRWSRTSWPSSATTPTRSATRCWPRRSTTTCFRGSVSGCTRRTPPPCSRSASTAPRPSSPGTRAPPTTRRRRSAPASGQATRRCRSAAPKRPPSTTRPRWSCWPTGSTPPTSTWSRSSPAHATR